MSFDKYEHINVENKIYDYWEKNDLFKPKENTKKFSIVIPPPNVTGIANALFSCKVTNALLESSVIATYSGSKSWETVAFPSFPNILTPLAFSSSLRESKAEKDRLTVLACTEKSLRTSEMTEIVPLGSLL